MQPVYDAGNLPSLARQQQLQYQIQQQQHMHPITQQPTYSSNLSQFVNTNVNLHSQQHSTNRQYQQQQQQQHHHAPHISKPVSSKSCLGSKDLIIRMLAEVFQVVRSESSGQLRWHQLSSSLIPVSLYSRTTGKWLDYLTAASSLDSNQEQSAMSPDSRQFLLLLQQIHRQQSQQHQLQHLGSSSQSALNYSRDLSGDIVFQVIAHDLIEGECKVILNAKLCQPGTRIGQASDFFVYWRDSPQTSHLSTSSCCLQQTPTGGTSSNRIWGLNFASINDANLFYDICSLNLTDLDFNHEYLKQLANKNKQTSSNNLHVSQVRQSSSFHGRLQPEMSAPSADLAIANSCDRMSTPTEQQGCLACKQPIGMQQARTGRKKRAAGGQTTQESSSRQQGARIRSRSTSRIVNALQQQPTTTQPKSTGAQVKLQSSYQNSSVGSNLKRSQSLSTPTTPEKMQVYQQQHHYHQQERNSMIINSGAQLDESRLAPGEQKEVERKEADGPSPIELLAEMRFPTKNRITTRRSTGIDSRNIREINMGLTSQRRARVAREMYANSKNLNEFLSLDLTQTNNNNGQNSITNELINFQEQRKLQKNTDDNGDAPELQDSGQFREVATTTEDLQLDLGVKRRMFNDLACNRANNFSVPSAKQRDPSTRRRSLERSFGIDMDLPSSKRANQSGTLLSPLRQSATSLVSADLQQQQQQQQQVATQPKGRTKQRQVYHTEADVDSPPQQEPRSRAKSSGETSLRKMNVSTRQLQEGQSSQLTSRQRAKLKQANSAPDVRVAQARASNHQIYLNNQYQQQQQYLNDNSNFQQVPSQQMVYRNNNLFSNQDAQAIYGQSSMQHQQRQTMRYSHDAYAQSCPSSLRRLPRGVRPMIPAGACHCGATGGQLAENYHYPWNEELAYRHQVHPSASRAMFSEERVRALEQRGRLHYRPLACEPGCGPTDIYYKPEQQYYMHQHHHQTQYKSPYQMSYPTHGIPHSQSFSVNHVARSPLNCGSDFRDVPPNLYATRVAPPCAFNVVNYPQQHHQQTSTINNFGTQGENDDDDDAEDEDADGEVIFTIGNNNLITSDLDYEPGYMSDGRRNLKTNRQRIHRNPGLSSRPQSAACMNAPMDRSTSGHSTQPVANYDKCLNRQALRARPRARSQPPRDSAESVQKTRQVVVGKDPSAAAVLAKSMENVQKLIREVQMELDSFQFEARDSCDSNNHEADQESRNEPGKGALIQSVDGDPEQQQQQQQHASNKSHVMAQNHPSRVSKPSEYKCVGAMRKAGILWAKKWLNNVPGSIELARGKAWRRYWVTLRGTVLLIHNMAPLETQNDEDLSQRYVDLATWIETNCADQQQLLIENLYNQWLACGLCGLAQNNNDNIASREQRSQCSLGEFTKVQLRRRIFIESSPRHLIIIDGSIAQPMPEHPRREHIFCLSTRFGDAFLFQAASSLELDNWICALHNACAASLARNLNRSETVKLFESRIRHLELEADKLLFLRQRLESRLLSMVSMSGKKQWPKAAPPQPQKGYESMQDLSMQDLLARLEAQLSELHRLLEQIHCEIYQLRCYLAACNGACNFYVTSSSSSSSSSSKNNNNNQLPDPRQLLKNVSEQTRSFLLSLGVFMVSSIQAYIHARQGSAETIIRRIRWEHERATGQAAGPLELDFLSMSLGDSELASRKELARLDANAQKLIEMSDNLVIICVKLQLSLYEQIVSELRSKNNITNHDTTQPAHMKSNGSSITGDSEWLQIKCELHQSDSTMFILRKLLQIIAESATNNDQHENEASLLDGSEFLDYYLMIIERTRREQIAKRTDLLRNWYESVERLELRARKRFQVSLNRSSLSSNQDNDSIPFGLLLEAQLFSTGKKNILSVFCSFIEWRSEAELKGLCEEDEIISINGIRTVHLDMMFIEWLMSQERHLNLVISSNHDLVIKSETPVNSNDNPTFEKDKDDKDRDSDENEEEKHDFPDVANKIIDDAYVSGLICPPPPAANASIKKQQQQQLASPSDAKLEQKGDELSGEQIRRQLQFNNQSILRSSRSSETISRPDSDFNSDIVDLPPSSNRDLEKKQHLAQSLTAAAEENKLERVRKSIMELIVTEFSYIIHLEEMVELFIKPLAESSYLNIRCLKNLGDYLLVLPNLHKKFLFNMCVPIYEQLTAATTTPSNNDHRQANSMFSHQEQMDKLEWLVDEVRDKLGQASSLTSIGQCDQIVRLISDTFRAESERLKSYASYSVAYSHLQRILHPKMASLQSQQSLTNARHEPNSHHQSQNNHHQQQQSSSTNPLDLLLKGGRNLRDSMSGGSSSSNNHNNTNNNADHMSADESKAIKHKLLKFLAQLEKENNSLSVSTSSLKCSPASRSLNEQDSQNINNTNNNPNEASSYRSNLISLAQMGSESLLSITSRLSSASKPHQDHQQQQQQQQQHHKSSQHRQSQNQVHRASFIHQQSFESYLIRPIQRIVRYPMLLKTILLTHQECLKPLTSENSPAYELPFEGVLRETIKLMEGVASHVNRVQQIYDQFGDLFESLKQEHMSSLNSSSNHNLAALASGSKTPTCTSTTTATTSSFHHLSNTISMPSNILGARRLSQQLMIDLSSENLLHFGHLTWLNSNDFISSKALKNGKNLKQILFVFESCVVFICHDEPELGSTGIPLPSSSKSRRSSDLIRYQIFIPVSQVQVRTLSEPESQQELRACTSDEHPFSDNNAELSPSSLAAGESGFMWELICCQFNSSELLLETSKKRQAMNFSTKDNQRKGKVYVFNSETSEERNVFLKKIRQTIRDSVNKMSIPGKISPDNKQQHQEQTKPLDLESQNEMNASNKSAKLDVPSESHDTASSNNSSGLVSRKTDDNNLLSSNSSKKSADELQETNSTTFLAYRTRCGSKKAELIA